MFWEPQNSSLHHEVGEILLPMVAESECTNCKQYIEWQTCMNSEATSLLMPLSRCNKAMFHLLLSNHFC